jgi:cytochrome d ubiquinol oxidase subunit I
VWISLIGFTVVYAILAVIEVGLLLKYIKQGAPEDVVADPYEEAAQQAEDDKQLYFAY